MVISQQALASHDRWSRERERDGRETGERREERGNREERDGTEERGTLPQVVASVSRLPDPALELDRARDHAGGLFPTVYPVLTYIHVALHKLHCTYISTAHLLSSINIRIEY